MKKKEPQKSVKTKVIILPKSKEAVEKEQEKTDLIIDKTIASVYLKSLKDLNDLLEEKLKKD